MNEADVMHNQSLPDVPMYREVARQIFKDFAACGTEIEFPEQSAPDWEAQLVSILTPVVESLISGERSRLLKIIYRVDLSENKLGQAIENLGRSESATVIAKLIVAREKLKVEYRRKL